jgi:peptidyl-prolyl cis-trans isomerase A (cyclophilin A)
MLNRTRSQAGLVCLILTLVSVPGRAAIPGSKHPSGDRVEIDTTLGKIVVALDRKRAPRTVANFLHYVDARFYDGGSFFRAVPGFVIQGGNKPRETPADPKLRLETPLATGIRNTDGAISMARTADPDSATSEFFICDGPQPFLDGAPGQPGYAAFGHVVSGMGVVRAIVRQPAEQQMLIAPVRIVRVVHLR